MLANGQVDPLLAGVGMNLRYAPHSEHGDDYFKDSRHHMTKKE